MSQSLMRGLTDPERVFVREYVVDFDAKRAAKVAGGPSGGRYLRRDLVQAEIARQLRPRLAATGITRARVLTELEAVAFGDAREYFDPDGKLKNPTQLTDRAAAGLASLEVSQLRTRYLGDSSTMQYEEQTVKVKRFDKIKALEILAKYTGVVGDNGTRHDPDNEAVSVPVLDERVIRSLPPAVLDALLSALDSVQPDAQTQGTNSNK
jgi:hypothetical protein